jgi:hypothetical protein
MTLANGIMDFSAASDLMVQGYITDPNVQENQWAPTIKHIKRRIEFAGIDHYNRGISGAATNSELIGSMRIQMGPTIMSNHSGGRNVDAAMPDPAAFRGKWVDISQTHLSRVAGTLSITASAMEYVKGKDAVLNAAQRMRMQHDKSSDERCEQMINAPATGVKGVVAGNYNPITGAVNSTTIYHVFLRLSTSTAMFHEGDTVKVSYNGSYATYCTGVVQAVCHDTNALGFDIGPGILVYFSTNTNVGSIGSGDTVWPVGEDGNACGFIMSIPTLWDRTYPFFNTLRTTASDTDSAAYWTNEYLNPEHYDVGASAAATVEFNIDSHFGRMFNFMAKLIPDADNRMEPTPGEEGITMSKAVICEAGPALVREIIRQANLPRSRFTRAMPGTLGAAEEKIFASAGASGVVLQDPGMPPIVVQVNGLMEPYTIRTWDPQQVAMIHQFGGRPVWLQAPGAPSIWNQMTTSSDNGATMNLTPKFNAGSFKMMTPFYFKPKTFYAIRYVKDSIGSIA